MSVALFDDLNAPDRHDSRNADSAPRRAPDRAEEQAPSRFEPQPPAAGLNAEPPARCVSADAQHVKVATQPRLVIALQVHRCAGTKRARGETVRNRSQAEYELYRILRRGQRGAFVLGADEGELRFSYILRNGRPYFTDVEVK